MDADNIPCCRYGLRYFHQGHETRLLQISGSGRLLLESSAPRGGTKRSWAAPLGATWETYEATAGQTYITREAAEAVARRLSRPHLYR